MTALATQPSTRSQNSVPAFPDRQQSAQLAARAEAQGAHSDWGRWTPGEVFPEGLSAERAERELTELAPVLEPCSIEKLVPLVEAMMRYVTAQNPSMSEQDRKTLSAAYRKTLERLPYDLANDAVSGAVTNHRYGRAPKPGDLRAAVDIPLKARRDLQSKLRAAASRQQQRTQERAADRIRTRSKLAEQAASVLDGNPHPLGDTGCSALVTCGYLKPDPDPESETGYLPGDKLETAA